jgi:hypothetical protein
VLHSSLSKHCVPDCLQNPDRWLSLGTVEPGSLAQHAVDVYFVSTEGPDLAEHAPVIQQFVAAGGGLVLGLQVLLAKPARLLAFLRTD